MFFMCQVQLFLCFFLPQVKFPEMLKLSLFIASVNLPIDQEFDDFFTAHFNTRNEILFINQRLFLYEQRNVFGI